MDVSSSREPRVEGSAALACSEEGSVLHERSVVFSPLLLEVEGVRHGFSTRFGGQSQGAWASLNVGGGVGDVPATVRKNRGVVLREIGCRDHRWVSLRQVHGSDVVEVTRGASKSIEGDGLWTRDPAAAVAITVADCVPILIAHRSGRAVAAIHAGWRGTLEGIGGVMVARLEAAGFRKEDLVVALGPCIGPTAFQVGPEVIERICATFPDATISDRDENGKGYANLWELNQFVLQTAGLGMSQIDVVEHCTAGTEEFYSYRREEGDTGRQCGIIARAP